VLEVDGIQVSYDGVTALRDVSFHVEQGEIVSIIGSNGAGKSTILKAISGLLRPDAGQILFAGTRIDHDKPHSIAARGIAHVPEGRRLFSTMTVWQNLYLGAYTNKSQENRQRRLADVFEIFPRLKERQGQLAGTLSGGEQQMLAIGRGLMLEPKLLMLDEPSLGLMPILVTEVFRVIREISRMGTTILLVEQNVRKSLTMADRAYVLQTGRIVMEGTGEELLKTDLVCTAYLGM
jgi:branched-chain amino acid transport system ATP-binding protein